MRRRRSSRRLVWSPSRRFSSITRPGSRPKRVRGFDPVDFSAATQVLTRVLDGPSGKEAKEAVSRLAPEKQVAWEAAWKESESIRANAQSKRPSAESDLLR